MPGLSSDKSHAIFGFFGQGQLFSVFHSLAVLLAPRKRKAVKIFDLTRPPGHKKAGVFGSTLTSVCLKTWRFERHMHRMTQSKSIPDKR